MSHGIKRDIMRVRVLKATHPTAWYVNHAGLEFNVVKSLSAGWYDLLEDLVNDGRANRHIRVDDCEVVSENQPASDAATTVSDAAILEAHEFLKAVDEPGRQVAVARHPLELVFNAAVAQAASGKGNERHGNGADFMEQPWVSLTDGFGIGGPMFQASKKLRESMKFYHAKEYDRFEREVLGALNYAAMAVLHVRKEKNNG